jgi:hypothetical protein
MSFEHKVFAIRVLPQVGELADVVYEVDWYVEARDGLFASRHNGTSRVPNPNPDEFVPFEDLTEEEVLGWLPTPNTDDLQRQLEEMVARQQAEVEKEFRELPWAS